MRVESGKWRVDYKGRAERGEWIKDGAWSDQKCGEWKIENGNWIFNKWG